MSIMLTELLSAPQSLSTIIQENKNTITKLKEELAHHKLSFITTVARGTSNHAAAFLKVICEQETGVMVSKFNHSVATIAQKTTNMHDSICIAISQSGSGKDTLKVAEMAKAQGAITIAVTNYKDSPLSQLCHYHFFLNCGEEKSVAATKTFFMQIACMFLLTDIIANKQSCNFGNLVPALNEFINDISPIKELAIQIKDIDNMVILSRGETLPIAEELSLKLLETCYKLSRCYSVAEFAHGPYALVEKNRPIILLAPDGIYRDNFIEITKRLRSDGAFIVSLTNIKEVSDLSNKSLTIPYSADNPFYYILAIQVFAATMAESLGLNPDSPRGLKKITDTL